MQSTHVTYGGQYQVARHIRGIPESALVQQSRADTKSVMSGKYLHYSKRRGPSFL